ncbi:hypothetical protein PENSPDRAFT_751338 [Peniophora sp. CONT]|nr:hypothetical protein PENSPDRAFT_751338 [Peniophora sp. CONT]
MARKLVFLQALPTLEEPAGVRYYWTVHPKPTTRGTTLLYPPATLAAASRRISALYENVIFREQVSVEDMSDTDDAEDGGRRGGQTTMFTWAPTQPSRLETDTFLRASPSRRQTRGETQFDSQGTSFTSDASSLLRIPDFRLNLNTVSPLSSLRGVTVPRKINVLLAVFEVEGPTSIKVKKGPDAGKEVSVLNLTLGDDDGIVCRLTAWREVADTWGGLTSATGVKRGDIVSLENVHAVWEPKSALALTASPNLKSRAEICYRTMPRLSFPDDARLRPDLELGQSEAAVRRVITLVDWFERLAGLTSS